MTIQTVTGPLAEAAITLADAHAHAWIAPPEGIAPEARLELNRFDAIKAELDQFCAAGGSLLIDCQPGGAGRDANRLAQLSQASGVRITATTGFHLRKYYPPEYWLWSATAEAVAAYFVEELVTGTRESNGTIRAATIKIGYDGVIEGQTRVLMDAAAEASRQTNALILFHTERGINVEALLPFFVDRGVSTHRLYLCHVDKRPDFGLHRELAQAGVLLGYDTFARPRYEPDRNVWPLLLAMIEAGLGAHVAIGQDMALPEMMTSWGGEPGLCYLPGVIVPRLRAEGVSEIMLRQLAGASIAKRLAGNS